MTNAIKGDKLGLWITENHPKISLVINQLILYKWIISTDIQQI